MAAESKTGARPGACLHWQRCGVGNLGLSPAALLLCWMVALAGLVAAPWPKVCVLAAVLLFLAIFLTPPVLLRLLRRTRWLLLAVFILFSWMTPGMPVYGLPGATTDGLQQGAEQLSRLLISLAMVAILLGRMSIERLLAGFHGLMRPLQLLGLDVDRFILRLALTLRQVDRRDNEVAASITLHVPPWRYRDGALVAAALVLSWIL